MQTIVISDCHGHPELVAAALDDAGFEQSRDRLVFAGDFLDRGPRPAECLALLEDAGAELLLGNHDAAILFGQPIWPQDAVSWRFAPRLLDGFLAGEWQLAAAAHGVLITHAGVTLEVAGLRDAAAHLKVDADGLADTLNARFRSAALKALAGETDHHPLLGERGPLWLRPHQLHPWDLPAVPQIIGHTDARSVDADALAGLGVHLVDPGVSSLLPGARPRRFRYAVVDEDGVRVLDRRMTAARDLLAS